MATISPNQLYHFRFPPILFSFWIFDIPRIYFDKNKEVELKHWFQKSRQFVLIPLIEYLYFPHFFEMGTICAFAVLLLLLHVAFPYYFNGRLMLEFSGCKNNKGQNQAGLCRKKKNRKCTLLHNGTPRVAWALSLFSAISQQWCHQGHNSIHFPAWTCPQLPLSSGR